jgi:hypothetical protein
VNFIGGNASGNLKLMPMLIHKSKLPVPLRMIAKSLSGLGVTGYELDSLPIIYQSNGNCWMTSSLFNWWLHSYFVPEVKAFVKRKNLPARALLLLDNAPVHPNIAQIKSDDFELKIHFLPKKLFVCPSANGSMCH